MVLRLSVALFAFSLLACSNSFERDNETDPRSFSHPGNIKYGSLVDSRDGRTYKSVEIGSQTWMAENLNYNNNVNGYDGSYCVTSYRNFLNNIKDTIVNDGGYCNIYGRLYGYRSVACPSEWHIPSKEEWEVLINYVEKDKGCIDCAGRHLKAKSGWGSIEGEKGNGLDSYGFAALPGGNYQYLQWSGSVNGLGSSGNWWASSGDQVAMAPNSYIYLNESSGGGLYFSVRCLKDNSTASISSSSMPSSSSVQQNIVYGPSINYKDETYKTVVIGTQTWFQRNLNYDIEGSKCYENEQSNCSTYGRLYDWVTAMALPNSCYSTSCASQIGTKHQGICPSNWHIPSNADWNTLMKFINPSCSDNKDCTGAGRNLKASSGWDSYNNYLSGNGTDDYGFAALPGGNANSTFGMIGTFGYWLSASEYGGSNASHVSMYFLGNDVLYNYGPKSGYLYSVRCVKD